MMVSERKFLVRVCVDQTGGGELYSMRLARPVGFADLGDLLLQVERVLERSNYPQTFLRMRRFQGVAGAAEHAGETMTWEQVAAASGTRAIFELAVKSRRRATWQGLVQWEGEPACVPFETSLEFFRLVEKKLS